MTPKTHALLVNAITTLDIGDRTSVPTPPDAYMRAAELAYTLVKRELGFLPMNQFTGPVESLTCTAENIFFESHGHFADLDGSGSAVVAAYVGEALLYRLRSPAVH